MTIDEAIKKCYEEAIRQESIANGVEYLDISRGSIEHCKQCATEHRQIAEWLTELKEAKRLLKAAVDDTHELLCDKKILDGNGQSCNICSYIEWCPCCKKCTIKEGLRNWRYADEALKLIGEQTDD